jgi:hypothetical protein
MLHLPTLTAEQKARGSAFMLGLRAPRSPLPRYLRRAEVTAKLQAHGFPIGNSTLASLAAIGVGPPVRRFGRIPLYRWDETLTWAEGYLSKSVARQGRPAAAEAEVSA